MQFEVRSVPHWADIQSCCPLHTAVSSPAAENISVACVPSMGPDPPGSQGPHVCGELNYSRMHHVPHVPGLWFQTQFNRAPIQLRSLWYWKGQQNGLSRHTREIPGEHLVCGTRWNERRCWASLPLLAGLSSVPDIKYTLHKFLWSEWWGRARGGIRSYAPLTDGTPGAPMDRSEYSHLEEERRPGLFLPWPSTQLPGISETDTQILLEFSTPASHVLPNTYAQNAFFFYKSVCNYLIFV